MRSPAFIKAERVRQNRRPATPTQRRRLAELSHQLGIEIPRVYWSCDAVEAITRLEGMLRQPMLEGFGR